MEDSGSHYRQFFIHCHALFPLPRCDQVAATSDEKLNQPLLKTLDPLPTAAPGAPARLGVNFDDDLVRLLRETKYFLLLKFEVRHALINGRGTALKNNQHIKLHVDVIAGNALLVTNCLSPNRRSKGP